MSPRIYQVDAFTDRPFTGNPAAVCQLEHPRSDSWMQSLAAEMNLAETAFLIRRGNAAELDLRWFTPAVEVDLCGHATLASAHVLWETETVPAGSILGFHTRSGRLSAERRGDWIELDFPSEPAVRSAPPPDLLESLSIEPLFMGRNRMDYLIEVADESTVWNLRPDFPRLAKVTTRGVIVTSRSASPGFDFVSRFFAPAAGIDEDPVTGSAHCCLAPYWSAKLGKNPLTGFQASSRGGIVVTEVVGDRVKLRGKAVTVLSGEITDTADR